MSVSATPFSELADYFHETIVWLEPGVGYKGVGHYLDHPHLIGFSDWKKILNINLLTHNYIYKLDMCYNANLLTFYRYILCRMVYPNWFSTAYKFKKTF